jgi:Cu-Zn family superoxide dismutase
MIDGMNRAVGEARLQEASGGVLLQLNLTNATPGIHGLHVHEKGACDPPAFTSAGGHFALDKKEHGFLNPNGPHAGDLPNIYVPSSLMLSVEFFIPDVTLGAGPRSLLDDDGSALIIHSWRDDYRSEPAGTAGERLACGRIVGPTVR